MVLSGETPCIRKRYLLIVVVRNERKREREREREKHSRNAKHVEKVRSTSSRGKERKKSYIKNEKTTYLFGWAKKKDLACD